MKQSDLIKQLRGKLTQQEFSDIVGIDRTQLSKYETGKHQISLSVFLEWCEKLNAEFKVQPVD